MRCIVLGDGRRVSLATYVKAWQACLTLPPKTHIGRGIDGWGQTAAEALRDLRFGLHDRINRHITGYGRGRKWDHDWQREVTQTAYMVNMPRAIVRWVPRDLAKRLAHRVTLDRD